jgi:hypothetical protein
MMLDLLTDAFVGRDITLAALGGAYLLFLLNLIAGVACFIAARSWLVISPNRAAKYYGLYVVTLLASLCIATVLENELVPRGSATLQYAAVPHLLVLAAIHLWIYYDQEPWLVALGASANAGTAPAVAAAAVFGDQIHAAHWLTLAVAGGLLAYLAHYAISTKRGFVKATSIYANSKEARDEGLPTQTPWLGLAQWLALIVASVVLATVNAVLRGTALDAIPALAIAGESTLMLGVTGLVCAVPAAIYWLAHKNWMPELTRFVWLVWLVVGFAFTYGNILTTLGRA